MEIIDNFQESEKVDHKILLRYAVTGIFFWIALVNLMRIFHDYFLDFLLAKIKTPLFIFWTSEVSNLLIFSLLVFVFVKVLNKNKLSNQRIFLTITISLFFFYIISFLIFNLFGVSKIPYVRHEEKMTAIYKLKAFDVLIYIQVPIRLAIIGILFSRNQNSNITN